MVVAQANWNKTTAYFSNPAVHTRWTHLHRQEEGQAEKREEGVQDARVDLNMMTSEARLSAIFISLQQLFQPIAGSHIALDPQCTLKELGIDSLMALELRNGLKRHLGIDITTMQLLRLQRIADLGEWISHHLSGTQSAEPQPMGRSRGTARKGSGDGPADQKGACLRAVEIESDERRSSMLVSPDGWIYFPWPNSKATHRLFCFPGAGASAALFFPWVQWLPESIELAVVQPPGRTPELDFPTGGGFSSLIEAVAEAIHQYQDRPFLFFGHSLGGYLLLRWHVSYNTHACILISSFLPAFPLLILLAAKSPW